LYFSHNILTFDIFQNLLADPEELKKKQEAVSNQGKKK